MLEALRGEPGSRTMALFVQGTNLRRLFPAGPGTILTQDHHDRLGLVLLTTEPAGTIAEARKRWLELDQSIDTLAPDELGPVTHSFTQGKGWRDHRTGLCLPPEPSAEQFRDFLLAALPLPAELAGALSAEAGGPRLGDSERGGEA